MKHRPVFAARFLSVGATVAGGVAPLLLLLLIVEAATTTVLISNNQNHSVAAAAAAANNGTDLRETLLPLGKCREIASCKLRGRRRDLDVGTSPDKSNCFCDQQCKLYDDCCIDSPWTETFGERVKLGADRIRKRRQQWHCKQINNSFGDVVVRASCLPDWYQRQDDLELANQTRRRCEYVKDRGKMQADENDKAAQLDPVGMMMPITDLVSGITYANSYCLRCNTAQGDGWVEILKRQKFIYWSPLLECNYNTDSDNRNTLYDLISIKKGQVLKYSSRRNKWIIKIPPAASGNNNSNNNNSNNNNNNPAGANKTPDDQRTCSITATIPDSVEHMIRFCKANLIRTCPPLANATQLDLMSAIDRQQLAKTRLECQFGHQSITYSLSRKAVYYNPACAMCNNETRIFCEPKSGRAATKPISKIQLDKPGAGTSMTAVFAPPSEIEMIETTTTDPTSFARANNQDEPSSTGAFSVLLDLYEPPPSVQPADGKLDAIMANLTLAGQADNSNIQQQQQQQQPQAQAQAQTQTQHPQCTEYQVYDPFHLTCRCMICGLNRKFVKGKCVDRSKTAIVYITDICLIISITSLALYLLLYILSTFDLRPLAVELARLELEVEAATAAAAKQQQDQGGESGGESKPPVGAFNTGTRYIRRNSGGSNEGSNASGPTNLSATRQSQSLSTRGVASLAGALLGAYLLFMFGHQTETGMQAKRQPICAGLAAATYYFFLVAFFWMFLLSYDIWRTLRLATCQLRAPALHSQSTRFLFYALLAIVISACLVALAVLIDLLPPQASCETGALPQLLLDQPPRNSSNCSGNLWLQFTHTYKPNFGHQPGSCWFSNRRALALFFGLPVALVMITNLIFFLHSSCMVIRTSSRSSRQLSNKSVTSSTDSSGHHNKTTNQPKFMSLEKGLSQPQQQNNSMTDFTLQNSLTTSSIISVQTLQSHLSASSSLGSAGPADEVASLSPANSPVLPTHTPTSRPTTPPPPPTQQQHQYQQQQHQQQQHQHQQQQQQHQEPADGAAKLRKTSPLVLPPKHAKLDPSLSSHSIATNHSACSSSHSIASSLAHKCDSHLQSIQSMMGSIGKDYRLYCRLCTIMGLTWLTGLLASLVGKSEFLWYLFVILNTLQGLFIFIAFGCNRSKLYNLKILLNYLKFWLVYRFCICCSKSSSSSSSSTSGGSSSSSTKGSSKVKLRKGSMDSSSSSGSR